MLVVQVSCSVCLIPHSDILEKLLFWCWVLCLHFCHLHSSFCLHLWCCVAVFISRADLSTAYSKFKPFKLQFMGVSAVFYRKAFLMVPVAEKVWISICIISCPLRATRRSHDFARSFRSLQGEIESVMMVAYRMNWQVLPPVFVVNVEPEDFSWNVRVDNDGWIV